MKLGEGHTKVGAREQIEVCGVMAVENIHLNDEVESVKQLVSVGKVDAFN